VLKQLALHAKYAMALCNFADSKEHESLTHEADGAYEQLESVSEMKQSRQNY